MLAIKKIREGDLLSERRPDLFLCACGYEGRAKATAERWFERAQNKVALGFVTQQELEYARNRAWFAEHGFSVFEVPDDAFRQTIDDVFGSGAYAGRDISIDIDISCMNRFRLAHIVDAIRGLDAKSASVTFHYSIASFTPPVNETAPTVSVEPVIAQFAGWTTRPDRPPAAVVGLGYEPSKAIGVVDHLEINNATWAFYPQSPVPEYYDSVRQANQSLLNLIQVDGRCRPYEITEPAQLFHEMNSLVDMLKTNFNPVLIPFGPKLFALVTLLVACVHDDVGVWRVSSGSLEMPVDRRPSGHSVSLSVLFSRPEESTDGEIECSPYDLLI